MKASKIIFLCVIFCLPFCSTVINPLVFWSACAAVILVLSYNRVFGRISDGVTVSDRTNIIPPVLLCSLPAIFAAISGKGVLGAQEASWVIYLLLFVLSYFTFKKTEEFLVGQIYRVSLIQEPVLRLIFRSQQLFRCRE